jgi:hypothetical protein
MSANLQLRLPHGLRRGPMGISSCQPHCNRIDL